MEPFLVRDCSLITYMAGVPVAVNLRELRDRVEHAPAECLYHHFCETPLRPTFDYPDYPNDFSVWAHRSLNDKPLAERLGIVNPYEYPTTEGLRQEVLEILDDRLAELEYVPWTPPAYGFRFMQASTVVFDTELVMATPKDLPNALGHMTAGSLYYHFVEARRRTDNHEDDFSSWLRWWDGHLAPFQQAIRTVDFYFLSLPELRQALVQAAETALANVEGP